MVKKYYNSHIVKIDDSTYKYGEYELEYYVLSSDICKILGKKEKIYGVEITKKYIDICGNLISQSCSKKSITPSASEIESIIEKFYKEKTSPISFKNTPEIQLI